DGNGEMCKECDSKSAESVHRFLNRITDVRQMLGSDVAAAFEGDPAAQSADETIFCYPGLFAIMVQRLAHEYHKLEVPLLPRIMTEYAHSLTGIDIHPGAKLGRRFFIDHGTGVVIGETTEIGSNVKVYQSVTLGAPRRQPQRKRRPFPQLTLHLHRSPMRLHHMLHNRQPQPRPTHLARSRPIHSIKSLKNSRQILRRHANPIITHLNHHLAPIP